MAPEAKPPRRVTILQVTATRRLYVAGRRFHHGLAGALLVLVGLALCAHDRSDWPWPLVDR